MEFHEKLQQLRLQHNLTQEQLAEQLYVSRTAVSKWESGRGYPNIDSLKSISKFFSVSIDDLLSGEELISLAEEDKQNERQRRDAVLAGWLDVLTALMIVLPLYGNPVGGQIYAVNLPAYAGTTAFNTAMYWILLLAMTGLGILRLVLLRLERATAAERTAACSIALHALAILFFTAATEPYVTAFLFLFFVGKLALRMKWKK